MKIALGCLIVNISEKESVVLPVVGDSKSYFSDSKNCYTADVSG